MKAKLNEAMKDLIKEVYRIPISFSILTKNKKLGREIVAQGEVEEVDSDLNNKEDEEDGDEGGAQSNLPLGEGLLMD